MKYFYMSYISDFREDLIEDFKHAMDTFNPQEVIFTGHSLGGAMVQLAAVDLLLSGYVARHRTVKVYTFGQPRFGKRVELKTKKSHFIYVGNYELGDELRKRNVTIYRVVHDRDLVPHIPPCNVFGLGWGCSKHGFMNAYPYHNPTEIWYNSDFSSYKQCDGDDGEDFDCSAGRISIKIMQHVHYFGIKFGCDPREADQPF